MQSLWNTCSSGYEKITMYDDGHSWSICGCLDAEEKNKKMMEVETALDGVLEMYRSRLGFNVKRVRGNGLYLDCVSSVL